MKIKLPTSWASVSVSQLIELEAIRNDKTIDEEIAPSIVRGLLIISLFSGIQFEKLESGLSVAEVKHYLSKMAFLDSPPSEMPSKLFYCDKKVWRVRYDITGMNFGEMVDLYELTKDSSKIVENGAKMMALFCSPVFSFKKLNYDQKVSSLSKAPVRIVYPLSVFFLRLLKELLESTVNFLEKKNQTMREELKAIKAQ